MPSISQLLPIIPALPLAAAILTAVLGPRVLRAESLADGHCDRALVRGELAAAISGRSRRPAGLGGADREKHRGALFVGRCSESADVRAARL